MKNFISKKERKESNSTCYFEFQKGKFRNKFWKQDSLYIHADLFDSFQLFSLFSFSVENFNYYGPNEINEKQWNIIIEKSIKNSNWKIIIEELKPWIRECFTEYRCFTICGI